MVPSVALVMALTASAVLADADSVDATHTRARLLVSGPVACLTRDDLVRRVKSRAPRVDFADDAAISVNVAVVAYRRDAQVIHLTFARPGEVAPLRVLQTHSCGEAADAVALILAVTLDPTSQSTSPERAAPERSAGEEASVPLVGASPAAEAPRPAATAAPAPVSSRAPPPSRAPRPPPPPKPAALAAPSPRPAPALPPTTPSAVAGASAPPPLGAATTMGVSVSASGDTLFGVAPRLMPGFSVSVTLEGARDHAFSPALSIGWTHVWRSELPELAGAASFTLNAATLDACPLRWRWLRLTVRPCAALMVGRLATHGSGTSDDGGDARPFSTVGLGVRAGLGQTVEVLAHLGVGAALVRDSYAFGDQVFYRAAFLTTSASLGIGFRLP